MGALEFYPPVDHQFDRLVSIEVAELVALAQNMMSKRKSLDVDLSSNENSNADAITDTSHSMIYLLRVKMQIYPNHNTLLKKFVTLSRDGLNLRVRLTSKIKSLLK